MFTVLRPPPTTPMWAQQAIFSFLFYAILCSKTSSPAFDDRFSWEAFMHGCLPTLTVPDVTRLMTAVFKNQYDTNNPATVAQEEWGVIPRLWAFLPLYHPWLQTSSPAAPAVVGCCSSGCRAKETETGDFYCSGCQHTVTRERPCASTSFSKYHQIWELLEDKACSHFSTQILKKKKKIHFSPAWNSLVSVAEYPDEQTSLSTRSTEQSVPTFIILNHTTQAMSSQGNLTASKPCILSLGSCFYYRSKPEFKLQKDPNDDKSNTENIYITTMVRCNVRLDSSWKLHHSLGEKRSSA